MAHGQPRNQFLKDSNPETWLVKHDDYPGVNVTINADDFDPKTMRRVNVMGQYLDEEGRVLLESIPKSEISPKTATEKASK